MKPVAWLAALAALGACHGGPPSSLDGDPARGKVLIGQAQCGACHEIPGVFEARGLVGPPLAAYGRRTMIAGMLPNTSDNLALWLRFPQSVTPGNAMPDTGLSEGQARDVAAYLYTLK
ncbi:MAG: c-type cytochrome [Caulobacteraceae bacterium]